MKKTFNFLFFYEDSSEEGETKSYIATSIKTACRKFSNWRKKTKIDRKFHMLDYEVECDGKFIDISDIPCVHQYTG